jgi:hypothetical protein
LGIRILKRLFEMGVLRSKKKMRVSLEQRQLLFAFNLRLNQIPGNWGQIAVRFEDTNGIRDGN